METKYNVGEKVLVEFEVYEITVTDKFTRYKLRSFTSGAVDVIYRKEDEIHGLSQHGDN